MKLSYCCLVVFTFIITVGNDFESKKNSQIPQFCSLTSHRISTTDIEKIFVINEIVKKSIGSESSKGDTENSKKRNRKGVKPLLLCIINGNNYQTSGVSYEITWGIQSFHSSCIFPGNAKRGPPQLTSHTA